MSSLDDTSGDVNTGRKHKIMPFDSPRDRKPFLVQVDRVTNVFLLQVGWEIEPEEDERNELGIFEVFRWGLEDVDFTRGSGVLQLFGGG